MRLSVTVGMVGVGIATLWIGYEAVSSCRSAMPAAWLNLRPGMARSQVLSIVGANTFDAREIKGFESAGVNSSMAGMAANWTIFLRYDEADQLTEASAEFINRDCGLFSIPQHSILP